MPTPNSNTIDSTAPWEELPGFRTIFKNLPQMFGALWEWRNWGCEVHAFAGSGIMRGRQQTEHQKSVPVDSAVANGLACT